MRASPDADRARAHVLATARIRSAPGSSLRSRLLRPGGRFVMIHRPESIYARSLDAFGQQIGRRRDPPGASHGGGGAIRILFSGVKGSRAPLGCCPGSTLHEARRRLPRSRRRSIAANAGLD